MQAMSRLSNLWRNVIHRDDVEQELDEEVRAMRDLLAQEHIARGVPADEALRQATLQIGGVEAVKDRMRDAKAGFMLDACVQDLRYAIRLFIRSPLFTLTAVLSLAVGIGSTSAIFAIANRLLLRAPTGIADPSGVVEIVRAENGRLTMGEPTSPYPDYLEIGQRSRTMSGVYGYQVGLEAVSLSIGDRGAEAVFVDLVTSTYFSVLQVKPLAGTLFGPTEHDADTSNPVVVLNGRFWKRRLNADPSVVGQTIQINRHAFTVGGVAAEDFQGMNVVSPDVWIPLAMAQVIAPGPYTLTDRRSTIWLALGGRLQPGVSISQAGAELASIGRDLEREFPSGRQGRGYTAVAAAPIPGSLRILAAAFIALLMGIMVIVLVIACADVSGVLLARAVSRRREIAVRVAMGAGRGRLIRQLLTEATLLFALASAVGLVLARWIVALIALVLPAFPVPVEVSFPLDVRVVLFALGVSLVAAVLAGLAPALHASKADVVTALKSDASGTFDRLRLRNVFVVGQVALSLVLIAAAALFVRALDRTSNVDAGFRAHGVELSTIDLTMGNYSEVTGPPFALQLVERIHKLPNVQEVTIADGPPSGGRGSVIPISVPGVTPPEGQTGFAAISRIVTPGYFQTLGIPLVEGRDFNADDTASAGSVAIVDESTARKFWPDRDPIGQFVVTRPQVRRQGSSPPPGVMFEVIGVARDLPSNGALVQAQPQLRERRPGDSLPLPSAGSSTRSPVVYLPLAQRYVPQLSILARARDEGRLAADIQEAVKSLDPRVPILTSQALDDQSGPVVTQLRVAAAVSGGIGIVAVLLAALGIYGVTAYTVARRTREIGIRVALGARREDILRLMIRQGMTLVVLGAVIGTPLSVAVGILLRRAIFRLQAPSEPWALVGAAALLCLVGLFACYMPVRRATQISAMEALRYE